MIRRLLLAVLVAMVAATAVEAHPVLDGAVRTPAGLCYPDHQERISSTLVDYGIPGGETAMARTVGLPAAIGTRMILEGEITLTGVHVPVLPEIYEPVLDELEQLDIACVEKTETLGQ